MTAAPIDAPVVVVDFSGDAPLLKAVRERFGGALAYDCRVGGTHWEAERGGGDDGQAGPKPVFFFAPDRIRKRAADWGPGGLDQRHDAAWAPFAADAPRWLKVVEGVGPDAVARAYAAVVDGQNAGDAAYQPMAGHFETSAAYRAALDLVFKGLEQPSGYTEPLLHAWRLKLKASA